MVEEQLQMIYETFPSMNAHQKDQYSQLYGLYKGWNEKINVISRKDIDNLYTHHVLHSLSIARFTTFAAGTKILDLGTGGGFPGIPLAIMFPEVDFFLLDSTRKKLTVVNEVCSALGINNVTTLHQRAEEHREKYDFIVVRAVADFEILRKYMRSLISDQHKQALPNGTIALKGGEVKAELQNAGIHHAEIIPIAEYFADSFFSTKHLIYIQN